MKKNTLDKIVMMLIALFTIVLEGKAQTKNDYYQMFWDKKIHYSEIPEDILSFVFREMHDDVQYNMGEIHCDAYEYKSSRFKCRYNTIVDGHYFNYVAGNYVNSFRLGTIKVESDGEEYRWPIAYRSIDRGIVFYAEGMSERDASSYTIIHGAQVESVFAYFNRVKFGQQTTMLKACLEGFDFKGVELITPEQFIYQKDKEYIVLSFSATYADKPTVVYTQPKYEVLAGQLMEISSGVNYEVRMFDVGSVALIDTKTMQIVPGTLLNLEGIDRPRLKGSVYEKAGNRTLYYCNSFSWSKYRDVWERNLEILSCEGQPIYILNSSPGNLSLEAKLIPRRSDIVFDIQETKNYICYCGTNVRNQFGDKYDTPFLSVIDKGSHEEVARYEGNKGAEKKNKYFTNIYVLDDENVFLEYNNYHKNNESNEIVNIPTLVATEKAKSWIGGEWKNESCGSVVEIYTDSLRFTKNDMNKSVLDAEKIPFKIDFVQTGNEDVEEKALAIINETNEADYLYIDSNEELLFYYSENGDMVYLEKVSNYTIEEQQQRAKAQEEKEAILQQNLADGAYYWTKGQWKAEIMGDIYMLDIDEDKVYLEIFTFENPEDSTSLVCDRTESYPKEIHYEKHEMFDDPLLTLVPGTIYLENSKNEYSDGVLYTFYDFDQRVAFNRISYNSKAEYTAPQKADRAQLNMEKRQLIFKYIFGILIPVAIVFVIMILLKRNKNKKTNLKE